jgi:ribosomal protein S18 acetylase RimI-like enzyme
MQVQIKTATASNSDPVVDTIARAFNSDPVARWFYADSLEYFESFPKFVRAFACAAFECGRVDYVDDYVGAALWLAPGAHPDEEVLAALVQDSIREDRRAEVLALLDRMAAHHPAEPHWYLPMIGIDPAKQGRGYGSALLKHALERCDNQGTIAYLESSNPKNIPLYERYGFESGGMIRVGSSPPLFPMLRRARLLESA